MLTNQTFRDVTRRTSEYRSRLRSLAVVPVSPISRLYPLYERVGDLAAFDLVARISTRC